MLAPFIAADPRSPHSQGAVNSQRRSTSSHIDSFPGNVRRDICNDMPLLDGCN
jgi:hypothetical protein